MTRTVVRSPCQLRPKFRVHPHSMHPAAQAIASQAGVWSMEIATESGPATAELDGDADAARFLFVLTHGAGGGVTGPDLRAARDAATGLGGLVARVLQPYRVRGARAPGPGKQDAAWLEIVAALRELAPGVPLVQGGRSNGARVACRTAVAAEAAGVVALAFPLHPPGQPDKTRAGELREVRKAGIPVLVVNGERDPFGVPSRRDVRKLVVVPGETHALKGHSSVIASAVRQWLPAVLADPAVRDSRPGR